MAKVEVPETRYARNGPVDLAYQVAGDGPIDVLFVDAGISHPRREATRRAAGRSETGASWSR